MPLETVLQWETEYAFQTLPDYLQSGLDVVFIGINPGLYSVTKGHYFARSTSRFWPALTKSNVSANMRQSLGVEDLRPEHDAQLLSYGFGLTDVVKKPSANAGGLTPEDFIYWTPQLVNKLQHYAPRVACFHGVMAYGWFLRLALNQPKAKPVLGPQPDVIGQSRIFVAPNPSPANAHFTLADQTTWYDSLADFLATS